MLNFLSDIDSDSSPFTVTPAGAVPTPTPQLTPLQQMQQLQNAGVGADQIASILGLPQQLVVELLGINGVDASAEDTLIQGTLSIFV